MNEASEARPHVAEPPSANGPVAVFESIHAVLAAERAFLTASLACDLVPIPRGVTSDCGLALLFRTADLASARALLSGSPLGGRLRGIFVSGPGGYAPDAVNGPRSGDCEHGKTDDSNPGRAQTSDSSPDPAERNSSHPGDPEPRP